MLQLVREGYLTLWNGRCVFLALDIWFPCADIPPIQNFEVAAMKSVKAILPSDAVVTVPTIHHFDDVAHVVIMDDCGIGALTLKQLMLENPPSLSVASTIGAGLGEFLGRLHKWGRDPQASNHAFFDTNQQGK